jgi:Na+-translocating ferredoxin:NAD+ oxidoreductase RnfC subunit
MNRDFLIQKVKEACVVGSGGGGFPTHIKLNSHVDTFIINCAECEPGAYSDKFVLENYTHEILTGIRLINEIVGAKAAFLAIKKKYEKIIHKINNLIKKTDNISVFTLDDYYPAGDEFNLVYEITGKIIPEGGIPINVSTLVHNVTTVYHIYRAINFSEPITSKYVSILGEVKNPGIYLLQPGTTYKNAITQATQKILNYKILNGGPLMGTLVSDENKEITQTTSMIFVLPKDHYLIKAREIDSSKMLSLTKTACEQCEYCTHYCPRFLLGHRIEPHKMMRSISNVGAWYAMPLQACFLCSGCGICELYACPNFLSPRIMYKKLKEEFLRFNVKNPFTAKPTNVHTMHKARKIPLDSLILRLNISTYIKKLDFVKTGC